MTRPDLRTKEWQSVRQLAKARAGYRCENEDCKLPGFLECHHIVSPLKGGKPYDLANIKVLCRNCHIRHHKIEGAKLSKERKEWIEFLERADYD